MSLSHRIALNVNVSSRYYYINFHTALKLHTSDTFSGGFIVRDTHARLEK